MNEIVDQICHCVNKICELIILGIKNNLKVPMRIKIVFLNYIECACAKFK